MIADYEARAAQVGATCILSVKAALERDEGWPLLSVYGSDVSRAHVAEQLRWSRAIDTRLARISLERRLLRRMRAARAELTSLFARVTRPPARGFCAIVQEWEANGFTRPPAEVERLVTLFLDTDGREDRYDRTFSAGERWLRRHGAGEARIDAFGNHPNFVGLRKPATDPLVTAGILEPPEPRSNRRML